MQPISQTTYDLNGKLLVHKHVICIMLLAGWFPQITGHHVKCWNDGTCTRKEQVLLQGTQSPGVGESEKKKSE